MKICMLWCFLFPVFFQNAGCIYASVEWTPLQTLIIITSCGAKAQQTPPRVAHRGIARFLRLDHKLNQVVTPHLHANRSSRFLVILLTKKERNKDINKEIDRKQYPVPRSIGDGAIMKQEGSLWGWTPLHSHRNTKAILQSSKTLSCKLLIIKFVQNSHLCVKV